MKTAHISYKKDHLTEHYRAIGPASLVAALMNVPRNRNKRLHGSNMNAHIASHPQQAAEQAESNHPHNDADQAIKNTPGRSFCEERLQ